MPYISKFRRKTVLLTGPENAGELNYRITDILTGYLISQGTSYQTFNDIIGALEGAKLEIYRRKIAPYENKKIKKNGDVY